MPPLPTIRTQVLASLAHELRFAPRSALIRQLAHAESLAPDIEPDRDYPDEWVIYKVTGYRPGHTTNRIHNCIGEDLLHDLSALCEHLSKAAKIRLEEIDPAPLRLDELSARWNASTKTIERLRRKGLTARRVLDAHDRSMLVFLPAIVQRFEHQHSRLIENASGFSRVDSDGFGRVISRAKELRASTNGSLSSIALTVATELGRSHEGVRQMLKRHDETNDPIFHRHWHSPDNRRRVAYRAWSMGIQVSTIAKHFQRTSTSVHRLILVERAHRLAGVSLPRIETRGEKTATDFTASGLPGLGASGQTDLSLLIAQARATQPPKIAEEKTATTLHTQLQIAAANAIAQINPAHPRAAIVDEAETMLRGIARVRALLVSMELGLALTTLEQQFRHNIVSLPTSLLRPMIEHLVHVVAGTVASHNPSRGGRLAAPIGLAITRLAHEWSDKLPPPDPTKAQRALSPGTHMTDWTTRICPWQEWLEPEPRVRAVIALEPSQRTELSDDAVSLLTDRYGWRESLPQTAAALAASRTALPHHIVRTLARAEQQALQIARNRQ